MDANRKVTVEILGGFVTPEGGGNPAGVVFDADGLSEEDMLSIARQVGLSETAFLSASKTEAFKLDFFTPSRRIAHCGHATIAAFSRLAALGRLGEGESSKETIDGPRRILIRDGAAYMEQRAPVYQDPEDWAESGVDPAGVLASLDLAEDDLDPRTAPVRVDTGNGFLLVGVHTGARLKAVAPRFDEITAISERLDLVGYYVFTTDAEATARDATTRMFAPRYAIEEESATGMAGGPLACLLHDRLGMKQRQFRIEQGVYMSPPSPSLIDVELTVDDGRIVGLMAGGHGRKIRELKIEI